MNKNKKEVLIVGVKDISTTNTGDSTRRDCMDFRLDYEKIKKIKEMEFLCIVLLADDAEQYLWGTNDEYLWMLGVIGYALFSYTGCAVLKATGEDVEASLIIGMGMLGKNNLFSDKSKWMMLGNKGLADKYEIECKIPNC